MVVVQCTQKLLRELKVELAQTDRAGGVLSCWHANLITLDRRKCVLFTNDETRYSFLVPCLKKPDFLMLDEVFTQNLFRCLANEGLSQDSIERVLDECREISFAKTGSRSVLGSMNDITNMIEWAVHDEGGLLNTDISKLNMEINRMPSGPLGYKYSIDLVRELLG